jgi:NEDD4-binding protein 2
MATETVKQIFRRLKQERRMKAIVYRGCSGAGKSTMAMKLVSNYGARVFSADHFFQQNNQGKYEFDPSLLSEAHQWCLKGWIVACSQQQQLIVCDNTNTSLVEFAPYVAVAQAYGYNVEIITLIMNPEKAYQRNRHSVTLEMITDQHARLVSELERFPPWWHSTVVDLDPKQPVLE